LRIAGAAVAVAAVSSPLSRFWRLFAAAELASFAAAAAAAAFSFRGRGRGRRKFKFSAAADFIDISRSRHQQAPLYMGLHISYHHYHTIIITKY
jgi:hypothetical protein